MPECAANNQALALPLARVNPGGHVITIPISGEGTIGLLKAAIKKAGLTEEEFERLL